MAGSQPKTSTDLGAGEPIALRSAGPVSQISRILPHEEDEAKKLLADHMNSLGVEKMPTPTGYYVLVKTYVREDTMMMMKGPDGKDVPFYSAPMSQLEDQYTSIAALVLAVGPEAYKGDRFASGPWCKVGDWIIVPRNEGFRFVYGGVAMQALPDDKVIMVIDGPEYLSQTYIKPRI